jgi:tRNA 2-thiouridine synthesizing protein A
MTDQKLDFKGLRCPMPIVRLSQATRDSAAGAVIQIEATDAAFKSDLAAWARRRGFTIREFCDGAVKTAVIQKD